ncbi:MAG: hypothetical protein QT05_C0034G0012 [archaeon GW2011_AR13]|nr:MAG: hypothetical protein QT05_C0034G0012 [archaeon GW2011_AR13]HIG94752.1 hypothetical protein [Nanoarchaeota archaeon]HIH63718.1 hypothetical protein [Nanoarchaeota archaeon]HIJ09591.1 hypothetical protein [Nanoarchaeota archaeon]
MGEKYYSFDELINMIDGQNQKLCHKLYFDNKQIFEFAKGSKVKHHYWEGGYINHLTETMNIAVRLFNNLNSCRELPFSLSDVLLILFLHDLEKPWKYSENADKINEFKLFPDSKSFVKSKIKEYGFNLSMNHLNALEYVHGEGEDYHPSRLIQSPLGALVHACDNISARIWPDFPKEKFDSWKGL